MMQKFLELQPFITVIIQYALWPLVALYTLHLFENEIRRLLGRLKKGRIGDIEFEIQNTDKIDTSIPSSIATDAHHTKVNQSTNDLIKKENDELRESLLYERLYQAIFSSQIFILDKIRSLGSSGISQDLIHRYFQNLQEHENVNIIVTFEEFLGFLENLNLIKKLPNGYYVITDHGKIFLDYIEERGYPKFKDNN